MKIVKAKGYYWIPPYYPHWDDWVGPYDDTKEGRLEAKEDLVGMLETVNSLAWQLMIAEYVEQFEEEWRELENGTKVT